MPSKKDRAKEVAEKVAREAGVKVAKKGDAHEGPDAAKPRGAAVEKQGPNHGRWVSTMTARATDWLWKGYIPLGKLTLLDGEPGTGKSLVTMAISSYITSGAEFPDLWRTAPGPVLVINNEDEGEDTILPRVRSHGGKPEQIMHLDTISDERGKDRLIRFPSDIDLLDSLITHHKFRLVIIDPITNHLDEGINIISDTAVRSALNPLKHLAAKHQISILMIRHLSKDTSKDSLHRGAGSMGFIGVSRMCLMIARDPDNENVCILAVNKTNIAKFAASWSYQIEDAGGETPKVVWLSQSNHTARSMCKGQASDPEEKNQLDDAKAVLMAILSNGPLPADECYRQGREAKISDRSIRRAKAACNVKSERRASPEGAEWLWIPPDDWTKKEGQ